MEKMNVQIHQLVEQMVHTNLLTAILRTLNEMSYKMQHPEHQLSDHTFDREVMDNSIISVRECIQKYFADQLTTITDSSDQN